MQIDTASKIQVGRRVRFFAGYGGLDGEGLIVAVHGTPNPGPTPTVLNGIGRVMRQGDCHVDVVLFDGRRRDRINQASLDGIGIGYRLLDRVHGPALVQKVLELAAQREVDEQLAKHKAAADLIDREAARVIERAPLFYWNGIKDAKGEKLQKAWYSLSTLNGYPEGTITIYARDYTRFSDLVRECFTVHNDTDVMTDYFDSDDVRVIPQHPLYAQVRAAWEAQEAHREKRAAKRGAR